MVSLRRTICPLLSGVFHAMLLVTSIIAVRCSRSPDKPVQALTDSNYVFIVFN